MPHICLDARLLHATGIGTFLKSILHFFTSNAEYSLTLLYTASKPPAFANYPSNWKWIPLNSPIYTLKEQMELPLKIPSCDLYWTPHFNIPLFPIRAKKRLTTIHDTYHLTFSSSFPLLKRTYAKMLYHQAFAQSDHVTTGAHFAVKELQRFFPQCKTPIDVVYHPIFPHFKQALSEDQLRQIREKYKLPSRFLLSLGNFKPHKNLQRLLEAFFSLESDIHLVLIGPADVNHEKVHVLSSVTDKELPGIYTLASALIFPSLYEGFGLPLIEAMACKCPIISSQQASLPEVGGEAVEYIDPYSVPSIRQGIEKILSSQDRREELIEKGFQRLELFSLESWMTNYKNLIDRLVKT